MLVHLFVPCMTWTMICPTNQGDFVEKKYDTVLFERDYKIRTRDGVDLATDIYRPAEGDTPVEQPLPLVLHRTPYNKSAQRYVDQATYFTQHGYVVAVQDVRGRYASGGVFSKYETEAPDGFDTVEALAALPFVDGQVGMWGTSYAAHVQADAAKLRPQGLKTIVVTMGGLSDGWDHKIRNHGAFEMVQQVGWAFRELMLETKDPLAREMMQHDNAAKWLTVMPLRKGLNPLSISPNFEDYVLEMATHGDAGDWKTIGCNWIDYYDQTADIPMLHIGGWYDTYCGGTVTNYLGLSERKRGPIKLLMGPWVHSGNAFSAAGNVELGAEAAIVDFDTGFHQRWFDHYLKGIQNGVENEAPVRLFVMGTGDGHKDDNGRMFHGGYWRDAQEWPLPGTEYTTFYLHADGSLTPNKPEADEAESTTYTYDPRDPVLTIGGSFSGAMTTSITPSGGFDQREREGLYGAKSPYLPLKSRRDIVVFQTEPLEADVEVIGPIEVRLHASSSALDTDFTAKLVDVYPPSESYPAGYELNITDGVLRARYRNSPDSQEMMEPGEVYEFVISPFPTANRFKKGHRIRVDISSSNFPRFDVNPNSGEPLGQHRRLVVADNTIYHSADRASHIVLPLVTSE